MDKLESEFDTIWRNGQSSTSEIKNHNSGNNRENLNGREIKQFDYGLKMWAFNAMKQNPVGSQKRRPTNFWCGGGFSKSMYDVHYPSIPSYICPFQLRRVERDSKSKQTQSSVGLTSHKGDNFFSTSNCFESLSQKPVLSANQDIKDLSHLLTNLNLERYMNNFLFHEIDLSAFLTLNEKDLKELGVSKSARDKMLFAISDLNERRNLRESSPDPASRPGTEPLLLRLARQRPSPVLGDP
ncbi:protein bicaudal C homolog 1-A-like [Centruroides sculpturatus]|uniref:protein bicaudal C homolog 1-A-like n=1 Tax=Centruroides sculpturatus TaxID=218467 RepID=UPI000C6D0835|nr:protein bicaudal C homolog 1-A-like [Centruroides sculpturatus]